MGSTPVIQTSFNAGEWAPALNARVDVQKYHSGAALLRNFIVDYRGGATTRPGSRFLLPTMLSSATRLIPFQASFTVSYILEFGDSYIRFYNNGAPVLQAPGAITAITNANPGVITDPAHGYSNGDWIYLSGIGGTTQLNGNYYIVAGATTNTYTLTDLNGNAIDTTSFGVYTSGGTDQRIHTLLTSPYSASDLAQIKYTQNVNILILCHPNYPPYQLVLGTTATSWTLSKINFGATVSAPSPGTATTTLAAGSCNYAYVVTSVDTNGQESLPTAPIVNLTSLQDLRSVAGTNTVVWSAAANAVSYNVYKAEPSYVGVPSGSMYGFIGNCTGVNFIDSNIAPDFSQGPPVGQTPFSSGNGISTLTLTGHGAGYTSVPSVSFSGGTGSGATAYCYLGAATVVVNAQGLLLQNSYPTPPSTISLPYGVSLNVTWTLTTVGAFSYWEVASAVLASPGLISGGSAPANPVSATAALSWTSYPNFNLTWNVSQIFISHAGSGYTVGSPPLVHINGGGASVVATATATVVANAGGNPTVPGFFQQRLVLAGPVQSPQQFNMSQPGSYYNFNTNNPIEADDAIQGTLVAGQLNNIQWLTVQPQGLIIFSDRQAWLVNGGSPGSPISAIQIVANSQAFNGTASVCPPIVANDNILYVQSKGSIVRDLVFNFYTQVYTGADISVLSSHLFYGFSLREWAWAEEPFKVVWAVRNDGTMLHLTFLKEQELVAWTHSDTQGSYQSVASVVEYTASSGNVDAVYTVAQRTINGSVVQYIERFAEQNYVGNLAAAWCVDAGISYRGTGALTFSGAQHLAGMQVVGIATDSNGNTAGLVPFTMPVNGTFTLPAPATGAANYTYVLVGLAFLPQLQTLALDTGEPTIQGKRKKITAVTVRCKDALGLQIGGSAQTLVPMKDLVAGNVGTMTNGIVTNLVTGDARTIIDPNWTVPGQYFIQQSNPFPASILGVIPEITAGDSNR